MRRVSFNWYRVLSNVITRRSLAKRPLYRQEEWLNPQADRQLQSLASHPRTSRLQAITDVFNLRGQRHTHAPGDASTLRIPRMQEFKQVQLAAMFKMVHAQREAAWNRLELLKQGLWKGCAEMKRNGHVPASWYRSTRHDLLVPLRFELPWYFRRPDPDSPSLLALSLQMYEVCKALYPTHDSTDHDRYGALEAYGISPLPGRLTMRYIEQLIDYALTTANPHGPWTLGAPSDQILLRESIRPAVQAKEPEWVLVAHLAQADMADELAAYERVTGIKVRTSLNVARLTEMLRVPVNFLPCIELLRVCHVRVADPVHLAKIFDHALRQHDWQIIAHILRDCDSILAAPAHFAYFNRREQLIRALVTTPAPVTERQRTAMMRVFETLRHDSLSGRSGQLPRSLHSVCLKYFQQPADPQPAVHPVHAKLRAWEAVASHVTTVVEKHWGTPAFPEKSRNVLKALYKIPVQVAEPVLMTLLAASDNISLYRQAVMIGLLTSSPSYTNAPRAGRPCMLAALSRNLSPLHAVLQHDALNLFQELVDPAYIFEGKTLFLDGQQRPLSDCLARLDAHKIRRFVEAGGMPLTFSSRERAEAFTKSFSAAQSKIANSLPATSSAATSATTAYRQPNDNFVAYVDAVPVTEESITELIESRSRGAIKQAVALCERLATPTEKHHAAAMVLRLWRHAMNPKLNTGQQDMLFSAVRAAAFRMKVQFTQNDLNAFIALGVHQRRLPYIIDALSMPYDSVTRIDPMELLKNVLPLCLSDSKYYTRGHYSQLNRTVAVSGLVNSSLDVYACELLYPTGKVPTENRWQRGDPQDVFQSLAVDLAPLFSGSEKTATAHIEKILEHADKWQSLSPKARFKRTEDVEKLRDDIKRLLQRIAHLRMPIGDIHTLFRAMCIVNHSKLTYELLKVLDLNEKALNDITRYQRWNCFEMILEHGADKVFQAVHLRNGYPDHWLKLSAKRIEQSLQQSGKRGIAVFDGALSTLSHVRVLSVFMRWVRECPEFFIDANSQLYKLLCHCAHPNNDGLSEGDVKILAQCVRDLRGQEAYRTIMRAIVE